MANLESGLQECVHRGPASFALEWVPKLTFPMYEYPVSLEQLQVAADLSLRWGLVDKKVSAKDVMWPTALEK